MTESKVTSLEQIKPGNKVRIVYREDWQRIAHIIAIIDGDTVLWCYLAKTKRRWEYKIEHMHFFRSYMKSDDLFHLGKSEKTFSVVSE